MYPVWLVDQNRGESLRFVVAQNDASEESSSVYQDGRFQTKLPEGYCSELFHYVAKDVIRLFFCVSYCPVLQVIKNSFVNGR